MESIVLNVDYNKIIHTIPSKSFDCAIVDIPYGIGVAKMPFTQVRNREVKQKNGSTLIVKGNNYTLKDWDTSPPPQEYFDELKRISHNQIIFGIDYVDWKGVGPGRIKWNKCVPGGLSFKGYETAYCSFIDSELELKLLWNGFRQAKSLEFPTIQQGNKKLNEKRIHPCHKPMLLYDLLIKTFNLQNKRIIDTHLGGGEHTQSSIQS